MIKKKSKVIIIMLLAIILIILISCCFYVNRENFISVITNKNQILKVQEDSLLTEGESIINVDISKWDTNKVNIVYDKDNLPVPVPKGYVASSVENGVTPIGQVVEEENRVNTGFVIYEMTSEEIENGTEVSITKDNFWEESKKRNQWVWVPVPDSSRIYERDATTGRAKAKLWSFTSTGREIERDCKEPEVVIDQRYENEKAFGMYDMQEMTRVKLLEELENEFEATIESIEKYGGFYIGRYETGNVGSGSYSSHNTPRQPVVQRMNANIGYVTWYDAYNNIKNIQINENVKSNIIWGSLWDETLQWLVDSGDKTYGEIKNSVEWGHHGNSEFEYITEDGISQTKSASGQIGGIATGSSEKNKSNNIYDVAGNKIEWTLEMSIPNNFARVQRGGSSTNDATPKSSDSRSFTKPTENWGSHGVRAYLYIKQ